MNGMLLENDFRTWRHDFQQEKTGVAKLCDFGLARIVPYNVREIDPAEVYLYFYLRFRVRIAMKTHILQYLRQCHPPTCHLICSPSITRAWQHSSPQSSSLDSWCKRCIVYMCKGTICSSRVLTWCNFSLALVGHPHTKDLKFWSVSQWAWNSTSMGLCSRNYAISPPFVPD